VAFLGIAVVNVALSAIRGDLGRGIFAQQRVVDGYLVGLGWSILRVEENDERRAHVGEGRAAVAFRSARSPSKPRATGCARIFTGSTRSATFGSCLPRTTTCCWTP